MQAPRVLRFPSPFILAAVLAVGCSTTRVVAVPAGGVALDVARGTATIEAEGVEIVVRPSAWQGSPSYLPGYVTPFHLVVTNGSRLPLQYDYADLRLFDEARFQYTALPPGEVERILRSTGVSGIVIAASAELGSRPVLRRHRFYDPFWSPWWWGPPYHPYYAPPRLDDVFLQALPVGVLQAGARGQGFVYFPRLRPGVSRLTFEFHHRLGDTPRVLTLPFGVERTERGGGWAAS